MMAKAMSDMNSMVVMSDMDLHLIVVGSGRFIDGERSTN